LVAEFVNGWNDAPNAVATIVGTRIMQPLHALLMAAALNILGAVLTGTAVAATVGTGIIKPEAINLSVVGAGVLGIAIFGIFATMRGIPISISHGLVSGLAGAGLATAGVSALEISGWEKVGVGLVFSTLVGFTLGLGLMLLIKNIFRYSAPGKIRGVFGRIQILSAAFMAFSHGSNDGQKFMGVFSLALVMGGVLDEFSVPFWVILLCGTVMGLGTVTGGWRVMKTMGFGITRLEPVQGFAAETAAATAIQVASHFGIPLSTTHTITTAIMGVGSSRRLSSVKWSLGKDIVITWLFTFPVCFAISAGFALLFKFVF
jgi:PiT family inorganic phosphate transporter